jgi:hypothetical protein
MQRGISEALDKTTRSFPFPEAQRQSRGIGTSLMTPVDVLVVAKHFDLE